ncbi:hypothetical protein L210DRAFT_3588774 [Boletus edulis BED1]|uniref:Peptidase M3A/M3B catalytic domain-containing protein n=1 Tax=Boletus edulis BED1 TaxID=1328754 RepID=A0AAD4BAS1_BOLED|nr:hypothetical protein L210DRAFT_3588774 [Boletus edulis BED1]
MAPRVQRFAVWEMDAKDESGFIGYCYLDLFPREGKYSHATVWGLLPGYELPERKRYHPLTASMVANLPGETNTGATNADAPRRCHDILP